MDLKENAETPKEEIELAKEPINSNYLKRTQKGDSTMTNFNDFLTNS